LNQENSKYSLSKILLVSLIFLVALSIIRVIFLHYDMKNSMREETKKEARVLKDYFVSMRTAYQEQFLQEGVEINENTLKFLPAHVSSKISEKFILKNKDGFYINSVSDKPRNPNNQADIYEMQAIKYFSDNSEAKEYFSQYTEDGKQLYQYAYPIYIKSHCLACHGKKEAVLPIIAKLYDKAYGYKEGDLRGIVSVKIPDTKSFEKLYSFIVKEIVLSIISIMLVLLVLYMTTKKEIQNIGNKASAYAYTDGLTGLYNRHYLKKFTGKFTALRKEDSNYAIAFVDIDDFKSINDSFGHAEGDCVLRKIATKLKSLIRPKDTLCRYGGEEFIVIFIDISHQDALEKAHQIRASIQEMVFECKKQNITISIGMSFGTTKDNVNTVIEESDKALYMAKESGKNCVKVFQNKFEEKDSPPDTCGT